MRDFVVSLRRYTSGCGIYRIDGYQWLLTVRERERGEESRLISKSNKLIKHEPMQRVYIFYDDTHFRPR